MSEELVEAERTYAAEPGYATRARARTLRLRDGLPLGADDDFGREITAGCYIVYRSGTGSMNIGKVLSVVDRSGVRGDFSLVVQSAEPSWTGDRGIVLRKRSVVTHRSNIMVLDRCPADYLGVLGDVTLATDSS